MSTQKLAALIHNHFLSLRTHPQDEFFDSLRSVFLVRLSIESWVQWVATPTCTLLERRRMPDSSNLPERCQACAKLAAPVIHDTCNFCIELDFNDAVLCDLNRSTQDPSRFECHAFKPLLKLASRSGDRVADLRGGSEEHSKRQSSLQGFQSDKIKYERALALQRLAHDPNGLFLELKYHLAWNVIHRRSVFSPANEFFDFVGNTFFGCSDLAGGLVSLLWLAPDHVHLYVESDGERSVEEVIVEIKRNSSNAMMSKLGNIKESLAPRTELWDQAYFVETAG